MSMSANLLIFAKQSYFFLHAVLTKRKKKQKKNGNKD